MSDSLDDLNQQITRQQAHLAQYEQMASLEEDPRRRLRLQENVEETKHLLLTLQTRLAQLRATGRAAPHPRSLLNPDTTLLANAPYALESELVGRQDEWLLLDDWFHHDHDHPLLAVIALGGMGKSALTWAWLQDKLRHGETPPLVVWWSFYETDGTMDKLLAAVLTHFGDDPRQFANLREVVTRFLNHLRRAPALLLLDGAERLLRAYSSLGAAYQADDLASGLAWQQARQCVDPVSGSLLAWLAQPGLTQASTLLTSRLLPRELEGRGGGLLAGVRRHDLTGLTPAAALALFRALGVQTTRAEVVAAGEPLGYHPLSLRLLAGYAADNPAAPGDLRAAAGYDPTADLLGRRTHVLGRAYASLPPTAQQTISRLAAFRGGVDWPVLADLFGDARQSGDASQPGGDRQLRQELRLLEKRGLLQRTNHEAPTANQPQAAGAGAAARYDLHPIVRRYAYERLADPAATHAQLAGYFEAVPRPARVQTLADLAPTIELYHHLARAGRYDEACDLFYDRLHDPLYFQLGAYQRIIELLRALFPDGEARPPRLQKESDQRWTLVALANSYSLAGLPAGAIPLFEQSNAIDEKRGDKKNLAIGLGNLAPPQIAVGQLAPAGANLRRSIALGQEIEERFLEAVGHRELGRLLATCGAWAGAAAELDTALAQFTAEQNVQSQGIVWAYRALAALLRGDAAAARPAAQAALRLADEDARTTYPVERDYVRAHWLLGWAALANNDQPAAAQHLDEALRRCRAINNVEHEPAILLAQARLAHAQGQPAPAAALAAEAQEIAARAGYALNLADIHNFLAQLALAQGDRAAARAHAQTAHDYAWCSGPPHAYQPALDEAARLLRATAPPPASP